MRVGDKITGKPRCLRVLYEGVHSCWIVLLVMMVLIILMLLVLCRLHALLPNVLRLEKCDVGVLTCLDIHKAPLPASRSHGEEVCQQRAVRPIVKIEVWRQSQKPHVHDTRLYSFVHELLRCQLRRGKPDLVWALLWLLLPHHL